MDKRRSTTPLVTIGIPVYNGALHLRAALDAIQAQDYKHLEVLCSDNASTDDTPKILAEYASRDSRIRVISRQQNIGATRNFNELVGEASGEFFSWAAHDDLRAPTHISKCVAALEQHPKAVLAQSRAAYFYEEPSHPAFVRDNPLRDQSDVRERFHAAIWSHWWTLGLYGVMRLEALRRTGLFPTMIGGDKVFVAELALQGAFVEVPEILFFYRDTPYDENYEARLRSALALDRSSAVVNVVRLLQRYTVLALRAELPAQARLGLLNEVARWLLREHVTIPTLHAARIATRGMPGVERLGVAVRRSSAYRAYLDPFRRRQ